MARSIDLQIAQSPWTENKTLGVRVRVQTANAVNIPPELFAYYTVPVTTVGGVLTAKFSHVCSPQDLVAISAGLPTSSTTTFFRLNYIDLFLTGPAEVAELKRVVKEDVADLKATLDIMQTLPPAQTITI